MDMGFLQVQTRTKPHQDSGPDQSQSQDPQSREQDPESHLVGLVVDLFDNFAYRLQAVAMTAMATEYNYPILSLSPDIFKTI